MRRSDNLASISTAEFYPVEQVVTNGGERGRRDLVAVSCVAGAEGSLSTGLAFIIHSPGAIVSNITRSGFEVTSSDEVRTFTLSRDVLF